MGDHIRKEPQGLPGWFVAAVDLLEQRTIGVNYSLYLLGFGGLALVARRVRPLKKFVQPSSIPKHFYEKKYKLKGKIIGIEFGPKPLLLLDHEPLLFSSLRKRGPGLPVSLESVNLSSNAVSWIQSLCIEQRVTLVLMEPHPGHVSSIVQPVKSKSDIANELVSIGFASVGALNPRLTGDKVYSQYFAKLVKAEKKAKIKGNGMWMDSNKVTLSESLMATGIYISSYVFPLIVKGTQASVKMLRQAIPSSTLSVAK